MSSARNIGTTTLRSRSGGRVVVPSTSDGPDASEPAGPHQRPTTDLAPSSTGAASQFSQNTYAGEPGYPSRSAASRLRNFLRLRPKSSRRTLISLPSEVNTATAGTSPAPDRHRPLRAHVEDGSNHRLPTRETSATAPATAIDATANADDDQSTIIFDYEHFATLDNDNATNPDPGDMTAADRVRLFANSMREGLESVFDDFLDMIEHDNATATATRPTMPPVPLLLAGAFLGGTVLLMASRATQGSTASPPTRAGMSVRELQDKLSTVHSLANGFCSGFAAGSTLGAASSPGNADGSTTEGATETETDGTSSPSVEQVNKWCDEVLSKAPSK